MLDRHGLVERRGRVRRRAQGMALSLGQTPNELWCTDYKGEFLLGNRKYCYPLIVTDHASRFLLTCEALSSTRENYALLSKMRAGLVYLISYVTYMRRIAEQAFLQTEALSKPAIIAIQGGHTNAPPRRYYRASGYTPPWDTYSKAFIHRHPICADPFGRHRGGLIKATVTGHKKAHKGNQQLMWDRANHYPLCSGCNAYQCVAEECGFGRSRGIRCDCGVQHVNAEQL